MTNAARLPVDFRTLNQECLYESDLQRSRTQWEGVLSTFDWWELSQAAIKIYGPICMRCRDGTFGPGAICVDHIRPRSEVPELALDMSNLQILCKRCNKEKGNSEIADYRPKNWKHLIGKHQPFRSLDLIPKAPIPNAAAIVQAHNERYGMGIDQNSLWEQCKLACLICSNHHLFISNWMKQAGASFTVRDSRYRCYRNYLRKSPGELEELLSYKLGHPLTYFDCDTGLRRQLVDVSGCPASQTSLAYAASRVDYESQDFAVI